MRLKRNIQETLKTYLFVSPMPVRYKNEYMSLRDEIFPNKQIFVDFLEAENYEEQLVIANEILLNLNYNSIFAPPTKMLHNLLNMEAQTSTRDNNNLYCARDHVVHQAHLYIFGVYVFFYHEVFAENIISNFRSQRRKRGVNANTSMVIMDFVSAWRTFVLFHDVGYPLEKFAGKKESSDDKFLAPFLQIPKFIGKDLSMRCISKIIAVSKLIDYNKYSAGTPYTFEELNGDILNKCKIVKDNSKVEVNESIRNYLKQFNKYILINKVYGIKTIQTIISIYGKDNIFATLCNKEGDVYMVFLHSGEIIISPKCPKTKAIMELVKNSNAPYELNGYQNTNLTWQYYIRKESTDINIIINKLFDLDNNQKYSLKKKEKNEVFSSIVNKVYEKTSANYANVISDSSFNQYCFEVYYSLYNILGYNKQQREDLKKPYIYHLEESIQNFSVNLTDEMTRALKQYFKDNEKHFKGKKVDSIIKDFINSVKNESDRIVETIKTSIESRITEQCKFKTYFEILRSSMGEKICSSEIEFSAYFNECNDDVDYSTIHAPIFQESENPTVQNLIAKLKQNNFEVNDLLVEYKLPYENNKRKIFDHGIFGCVFTVAIADFYQKLYTKVNKGGKSQLYPFKQIMNIALGVDYDINVSNIVYFFENTIVEALYGIMVHNIYPSQLKNKQFRTSLEPNPFAYFATLMDSLQFWNRDSRINQAEYDIPYATYSKSLNIEIRDNKIRITESDRRLDINQIVKKRRDSLNDYLDNASSYIELSLSNF